jgi:molybdate transport system ATP-binding protein
VRAIAGLDRYGDGFLNLGDPTWEAVGPFVPPHRRPLGYVFQQAGLFAHRRVRRNFQYGVKRVPASERKVSLERAIVLLGIERLLDCKPDGLSGGERHRAAIARTPTVNPQFTPGFPGRPDDGDRQGTTGRRHGATADRACDVSRTLEP